MSLQYVQHICDANNIELCLGWLHGARFIMGNRCPLPPSAFSNPSCAGIISSWRNKVLAKYIILANDSEPKYHKEATAWHELGHLMNNATRSPNPLENELKANEWVMENYIGNLSIDTISSSLKRAILTYIEAGYNKASPKYKKVGDWLGVSELIEWV